MLSYQSDMDVSLHECKEKWDKQFIINYLYRITYYINNKQYNSALFLIKLNKIKIRNRL